MQFKNVSDFCCEQIRLLIAVLEARTKGAVAAGAGAGVKRSPAPEVERLKKKFESKRAKKAAPPPALSAGVGVGGGSGSAPPRVSPRTRQSAPAVSGAPCVLLWLRLLLLL